MSNQNIVGEVVDVQDDGATTFKVPADIAAGIMSRRSVLIRLAANQRKTSEEKELVLLIAGLVDELERQRSELMTRVADREEHIRHWINRVRQALDQIKPEGS